MKKLMITAFNETKSVQDWLADKRCQPKRSLLCKRIADGWSHYNALTVPVEKKYVPLIDKIKKLHGKEYERFDKWMSDNQDANQEQIRKRVDYLLNEDRARLSSYKYAKNHREIKNAYQRKWRKANPLKRANHENTYRGSKRHPDAISSAELERLRIEHGDRCCYCGNVRKLTVEHIVPLSKGGTHTGDNILFACRPCNSSKFNKDLIIWMATGEHRGVWCFN